MKIIQTGNYPLNSSIINGGVEASIYGIAHALAKDNEVSIITLPTKLLKEDKLVYDGEIPVHYLCNPYKYPHLRFLRFNKFRSILKASRPDVVHIHENIPYHLLLLLYLRLKKINVVLTVHGILHIEFWKIFKQSKTIPNFLKYAYFSSFEYLILLVGKKFIVDTQYVCDTLSKWEKKQYYIVPQGIDDSYFELEDRYDPNNILSVGSISQRKGHEYLIQSVEILKKEIPAIKLQIAGVVYGSSMFQNYYSYLLDLIKEKKLEDNVTITPNLPLEKLKQAMEKCNIFVLHSFEESQGIAICEAMAAGKPIVSTNIGGIPYVVKDGVNGKLSAFGDVDTFSNHIREILLDARLRNRMGLESKNLSYTYSWDKIAFDVTKIYKMQ
jgi:glycosyltransferase involved in cell wall biosynthesis